MRRLVPLSATRTRLGLLAGTAAFALLAVVGCGTENAGGGATDSGTSTPSTTESTTAAAACTPAGEDLPEASGGFGEAPTFTWPEGCAPEGLQVEVLAEGDGAEVGAGAAVVANYAGYVWGSDTPFDSSYDRGAPAMFSLNAVVQGWSTGIPGNLVGSRLLISVPPDLGYGETGNAGAGIAGTDTIVFVVDVVETYNADAAGSPDAVPADVSGLPVTIEGDLGAPATLTVNADAADPAEAVSYPVAAGSGEAVQLGQSVAVAYTVTYWDGSSTETSWSPGYGETAGAEALNPAAGPMVATLGQGTIFDLLEGTTVGSRVVLVAPGSEGSPAIAVLVDVLGVG